MSYQFTFDWFTHNSNNFLAVRNVMVSRQHILEIGSFEGRSTVWIAKNILEDTGSLFCVDTWSGSDEHQSFDMATVEKRFDWNISLLNQECPSREVIKKKGRSTDQLASLVGKYSFDLIYVDGSHRASDCLTDAIMAWQILKKQGVMVFDDYGWRDQPVGPLHPKPAIDTFITFFGDQIRVLFINYQLAIQRL